MSFIEEYRISLIKSLLRTMVKIEKRAKVEMLELLQHNQGLTIESARMIIVRENMPKLSHLYEAIEAQAAKLTAYRERKNDSKT